MNVTEKRRRRQRVSARVIFQSAGRPTAIYLQLDKGERFLGTSGRSLDGLKLVGDVGLDILTFGGRGWSGVFGCWIWMSGEVLITSSVQGPAVRFNSLLIKGLASPERICVLHLCRR